MDAMVVQLAPTSLGMSAVLGALARSVQVVFARGFFISLTNPKRLLFYGAFFPQFLTTSDRMGAQVAVLAATFLAEAILFDGGWALLAGRLPLSARSHHIFRGHETGISQPSWSHTNAANDDLDRVPGAASG
jgi:threonine/homoserine/homoserine lactone efflux protein